jgi:hypothetical protein
VRLRNPQITTSGGAEVDPQEGKDGHRRRRRTEVRDIAWRKKFWLPKLLPPPTK